MMMQHLFSEEGQQNAVRSKDVLRAHFSELWVQNGRIDEMLECALFGDHFRRVNHIKSHSSLARNERRLYEIDGCCIVEDTLGLSPQAQISVHYFCFGKRLLQVRF